MTRLTCFLTAFLVCCGTATAETPPTVFNGKSLDAWELTPGGWVVESDGSMTCKMQQVKDKKGRVRTKGMGYIWTKHEYTDFSLSLSYKLSETANTGVFFRTDKDDPVQAGFEIQLLDNKGFQAVKGKKDPKNLNGAFYDCQAAKSDPSNPIGDWNDFKLTVRGTQLAVQINGQMVTEADISRWDTAGKNPDGTDNKFKTALAELPHKGRIGFQNHGNAVWFKDVIIQPLQ